jgi:hypothetical protein
MGGSIFPVESARRRRVLLVVGLSAAAVLLPHAALADVVPDATTVDPTGGDAVAGATDTVAQAAGEATAAGTDAVSDGRGVVEDSVSGTISTASDTIGRATSTASDTADVISSVSDTTGGGSDPLTDATSTSATTISVASADLDATPGTTHDPSSSGPGGAIAATAAGNDTVATTRRSASRESPLWATRRSAPGRVVAARSGSLVVATTPASRDTAGDTSGEARCGVSLHRAGTVVPGTCDRTGLGDAFGDTVLGLVLAATGVGLLVLAGLALALGGVGGLALAFDRAVGRRGRATATPG